MLHGAYLDRLEAALEGGILLDVLAVLVQSSGADALQLTACQRGLQDVGRVDRALRRSRADQRVHLVDHLRKRNCQRAASGTGC